MGKCLIIKSPDTGIQHSGHNRRNGRWRLVCVQQVCVYLCAMLCASSPVTVDPYITIVYRLVLLARCYVLAVSFTFLFHGHRSDRAGLARPLWVGGAVRHACRPSDRLIEYHACMSNATRSTYTRVTVCVQEIVCTYT